MHIIDGSGDNRVSITVGTRDERHTTGRILKRILFPDNAAYHKARRRGKRALEAAVA